MNREIDAPAFAEALEQLAEVFQVAVTHRMADAYFTALEGLSMDDFRRVTRRALQTCKFFPRPAELLEIADGLRPRGCIHQPMCDSPSACTERKLRSQEAPRG